jgi:hypothetical protein
LNLLLFSDGTALALSNCEIAKMTMDLRRMNMNNAIRLMMLMGMFAVVQPVMADQNTDAQKGMGQKVEQRVERQNKRIERKLKKKKISEAQATQLKGEVQAVESKKDEMLKANGGKKLTKEQHQELRADLKKTSEEIKASGSAPTTH